MRLGSGSPCAARALDLRLAQLWLDGAGNVTCDLVLQLEDVVESGVETLGPDMRARRRVDELPGNADPVSRLAGAAFEDIRYAQFTGYLLHVYCSALVGEVRISSDYEQPGEAGDRGRDLLDN